MSADQPAPYVGRRRGRATDYRSRVVYHAAGCPSAPTEGEPGVFVAYSLPAPEGRAACCLERGVTIADGNAPRDVQYGRDRYPGVT